MWFTRVHSTLEHDGSTWLCAGYALEFRNQKLEHSQDKQLERLGLSCFANGPSASPNERYLALYGLHDI